MAMGPDGYMRLPVIRGNMPMYTNCWGTWVGGCYCTHVLLVGFPWAAGWPLCELNVGLDGPLV